MERLTAFQDYADETAAQRAAQNLGGQMLVVTDKKARIVAEAPPSPYTTLDMLEDAALLLGWGGRKTMAAAQTLFEQGWITYPRSDSTAVAPEAVEMGQSVIVQLYGADALPQTPAWRGIAARLRVRAAGDEAPTPDEVEAHEAIRPTDPAAFPDALSGTAREPRALYRLIWQRFLASQMRPARYQIIEATFEATT